MAWLANNRVSIVIHVDRNLNSPLSRGLPLEPPVRRLGFLSTWIKMLPLMHHVLNPCFDISRKRLMEEGVCVQITGDWAWVPLELRPIMAKAMILTRHNRRAKLNVAFAYTGRNEITRGIQSLQQGVLDGNLEVDDLNEDLLSKSFHILPTLPLDLLVRTSGETRLSDFLLWQVIQPTSNEFEGEWLFLTIFQPTPNV